MAKEKGFVKLAGEKDSNNLEQKLYMHVAKLTVKGLREKYKNHANADEIIKKQLQSPKMKKILREKVSELQNNIYANFTVTKEKINEYIQQNKLFALFKSQLTLFDIILEKVAAGVYDAEIYHKVEAEVMRYPVTPLMVNNVVSFIKQIYFDGKLVIAEEMNLSIWEKVFAEHKGRIELFTDVKAMFVGGSILPKGMQFFLDIKLPLNLQDNYGQTLLYTLFDLINKKYHKNKMPAEHLVCVEFIRKLVAEEEITPEINAEESKIEDEKPAYKGADPTILGRHKIAPLHLMTIAIRDGNLSLKDAKLVLKAVKLSDGDINVRTFKNKTLLDYLQQFAADEKNSAMKQDLEELAKYAREEYNARNYSEIKIFCDSVNNLCNKLIKDYGSDEGIAKFKELTKSKQFMYELDMLKAILQGNLIMFEQILKAGFDPSIPFVIEPVKGKTLKELVMIEDSWKIKIDGEIEIYKGPFINYHHKKDGNTPLHLAAISHDFAYAKMLIAAGFDQRISNNDGLTPLHEAFGYSMRASMTGEIPADKVEATKKMTEYLQDKYPYMSRMEDQAKKEDSVWRAQDLAEILQIFNPNQKDINGLTILMIASSCGHYDFTKQLLECPKVDTDIADNGDENHRTSSAMQHAFQSQQYDIIKLFLQKGVSVDKLDNGTPFLDYIFHFATTYRTDYSKFVFDLLRDQEVIKLVKGKANLLNSSGNHPLLNGIIGASGCASEEARKLALEICDFVVDNYDVNLNSHSNDPASSKSIPMLSLFAKYHDSPITSNSEKTYEECFKVLIGLGARPILAISETPELTELIITLCEKHYEANEVKLLRQDVARLEKEKAAQVKSEEQLNGAVEDISNDDETKISGDHDDPYDDSYDALS